jgi:uncharacterized protein YycO
MESGIPMNRLLSLGLTSLLAAACNASSGGAVRPTDVRLDRAVDSAWTRDIQRVARSGDWILSRSYSATGDLIVASTIGESFSHASIYDAERGTIIEAISPVVREVPLASLVARNRYVLVVRPAGLSEEARLASVARARAVVGAPFDYGGVVGFDTRDRYYCSELVAWAARVRFDEIVLSPADLVDYGEVVYWSGSRDDRATQQAALASNALVERRSPPVRVASAR